MPEWDRLVGDSGQTLTLAVAGSNSLAGGSATVKLRKPDGTNVTKTGALDAGARTVSYIWEAGVLDAHGRWRAWGFVTVGSVVSHCLPVDIMVGPAPA